MSLSHPRTLWLAGLASLAVSAAPAADAAGVKVSFIEPDRYADAGNSPADREAKLAALGAHLTALGQRLLPAEMTLEVEVLEVDLAGTMRPSRRGDRRIVRGQADWPRMTLRYSLVKDGQVQATDTEHISDLNYTMHLSSFSTDPLRYEKGMLDDWFRTRFADRLVATAR